ncbi:MAG: TIGR04013 family B12-binding domain/radical SAM domain-containing protein [Candidatus Cloacimonetes bacterium]|nr:TIGR04013 family B12-binding domain/radical SAM domain-containing protein [Candidatus Cloacimonadota bacterium]
MCAKIAILFYYKRENRYSFNALAGAMEQDSEVKKIDVYFISKDKDIFNELPKILDNHEKLVFGISFSTPQFWEIKDLVEKSKRISNNKILFLAGGPHPTGDPYRTLHIGFDLVIRGEGEEVFLELLKKITNKEDYFDLKGISYLDANDEYIFTGKREWLDINKYLPISEFYSKYGPIEITRGCPFACSYCQTSHIFGTKPRHRSIDTILNCVTIMKERNLNDFRVITPNAFSYGSEDGKSVNLEKLESLLSNVRNIIGKDGRIFFGSFPSEVRPEHVNLDTVNLVLKYGNNDNLVIGAQSGSQSMLDFIRRGHDVKSIYSAVEITRKAGLKANVDFIFGLPNESDEDISLTLKVIKDLNKLGARIHAHTFMPLPQTTLKKEKGGKISPSLRKEINRLYSNGILYGDWQNQEKIAAKITTRLRVETRK